MKLSRVAYGPDGSILENHRTVSIDELKKFIDTVQRGFTAAHKISSLPASASSQKNQHLKILSEARSAVSSLNIPT